MLGLGIGCLIVFLGIGAFLFVKGHKQGAVPDQYGTTGGYYKVLAVVCVAFAIGMLIWGISAHNSFKDSPYSGTSSSSNSKGSVSSSFTNKYGTRNTKCYVSGCNNYIAKSGDTNCCVTHSNKCLECHCYIDGDAMYCMDCIKSALN